MKVAILLQLLPIQTSFGAKGLLRTLNRNFTAAFADRTSFRAKGLPRTLQNRNFTAAFARNLISCKRVAVDTSKSRFYCSFCRSNPSSCEGTSKSQFYCSFCRSKPHFVRKGCRGRFQIAILLQLLPVEPHFVRRGCRGHFQIAILLQLLPIEPHFVRKRCLSSRLVGTAPGLKREDYGEEVGERKRRRFVQM